MLCHSLPTQGCSLAAPPDTCCVHPRLQAVEELDAADPSFLQQHPAAAFALHRCRFLEQLATPREEGGGVAAALAVVRRQLSPLAQHHPELLQAQLKAAMAQLLPASGDGGDAHVAAQRQHRQGVADAVAVRSGSACQSAPAPRAPQTQPPLGGDGRLLNPCVLQPRSPCSQAMRAALRPRCHVREPRLLPLLRDLLRWAPGAACAQGVCGSIS